MVRYTILVQLALLLALYTTSHNAAVDACTVFIAGREATVDGSVLVSTDYTQTRTHMWKLLRLI